MADRDQNRVGAIRQFLRSGPAGIDRRRFLVGAVLTTGVLLVSCGRSSTYQPVVHALGTV